VSRMAEPIFKVVALGRPITSPESGPTIRASWTGTVADNFITVVLKVRT
jgi:hypothetical protein